MKKVVYLLVILIIIPIVFAGTVTRTFDYQNPATNTVYTTDTVTVVYSRTPTGSNPWLVNEFMPSTWTTTVEDPIGNRLKFMESDNTKTFDFVPPTITGTYDFNDGTYWTYPDPETLWQDFPTETVNVEDCTYIEEESDANLNCDDTIDNDCDYFTDSADPDCTVREICGNGIDDDLNGDTDCQDVACPSTGICSGNCALPVCDDQGATPTYQWICTADQTDCTGTCSECSGSGNTYNCQAKPTDCSGNCFTCSGSGTVFNCQANEAACSDCFDCTGSVNTFNCQAMTEPNDGTTCDDPCTSCVSGVCRPYDYGTVGECGSGCQRCDGTQTSCVDWDSACNSLEFYEYACPWGTAMEDNTGRKFHDFACISDSCSDQGGSWETYQDCGLCEYCNDPPGSSTIDDVTCEISPITQLCNSDYECAAVSGNNYYTTNPESTIYQYNAQGFCDAQGNCDYATGSQCDGRENDWCRPDVANCNNYCTAGGSDDDQDGLTDDCDADCCTNCDFDNDGWADQCDTDDDNDGILDTLDCHTKNPSTGSCGGVGTTNICSEDPTSDTSSGTCVTCTSECALIQDGAYGPFYCDSTNWQTGTGTSHVCADGLNPTYSCDDGTGNGDDIYYYTQKQYCGGAGSCDGALVDNPHTLFRDCAACEKCSPGSSICAQADDASTCGEGIGTGVNKCCSGVCDNSDLQTYDSDCRSGPACIAAGNYDYSIANENNPCGDLECDSCSSGYCTAQTADNGANCNDDCTKCDAGTCIDRGAHDWTECTSQCTSCTNDPGPADNCQPDTFEQGFQCLDPGKYCDAGTCCVDLDGNNECDPALCIIDSLSWSQTTTAEGALVNILISGTDCDGKQLSITIMEKDLFLLPDDEVNTFTHAYSTSIPWTTIFVEDEYENPEYYIKIDVDGNTYLSDLAAINLLEVSPSVRQIETRTINLKQGKNPFSLPLILDDLTIDSIFTDISNSVDKIYTYDNGWKIHHFDGKPSNLDSLELGQGYMIFMNQNADLEITGSKRDINLEKPTLVFSPGWNYIGTFSISEEVQNVFRDIVFTELYSYNDQTGEYEIITDIETILEEEQGYWIYVDDETDFSPLLGRAYVWVR